MKITYLFILFFGSFYMLWAQPGRSKLLGKVVAKSRDLQDIYVQNKTTGEVVVTESGGYFNITAQPTDTLILAGVNFVGRNKIITYGDMNKTMLLVPMESVRYMLDELVIDKTITAASLGLPTGKVPTPAERRLHTATSSGGGILPIDAIVNAISGRTKMLKKALAYEQEEMLVQRIINKFPEEYYTAELKIPKLYITAFGYYLSQDKEVLEATENKAGSNRLKFLYAGKVREFLELIKVLQ